MPTVTLHALSSYTTVYREIFFNTLLYTVVWINLIYFHTRRNKEASLGDNGHNSDVVSGHDARLTASDAFPHYALLSQPSAVVGWPLLLLLIAFTIVA